MFSIVEPASPAGQLRLALGLLRRRDGARCRDGAELVEALLKGVLDDALDAAAAAREGGLIARRLLREADRGR